MIEANLKKHGDREPFLTSVSVGLLLTIDPGISSYSRLLLVQQQENKQWGVIAGGVNVSVYPKLNLLETPSAAVIRELYEETQISKDELKYIYKHGEIWFPTDSKLKMGLIYESIIDLSDSVREKKILQRFNLYEGYRLTDKKEIAKVRAFTQDEVHKLIQKPDNIYKPEFNERLLKFWLYNQVFSKYDPWDGPEFAEDVVISRYGLDSSANDIFI